MSHPELNASKYPFVVQDYKGEFEKILSKVIISYNLIIVSNVVLINDENSIRDHILINYLKNQKFKEQYELTNYLFDRELPEYTGRIDIRVIPVNPLINDDAYYVIECKRLNAKNPNGKTGLNAKFIEDGICRFVSEKYTSYFGINAMIGFIVQPVDIAKNVKSINRLLHTFKQAKILEEMKYCKIVSAFDYSYYSTHSVSNGHITIYHLMLDLTPIIK